MFRYNLSIITPVNLPNVESLDGSQGVVADRLDAPKHVFGAHNANLPHPGGSHVPRFGGRDDG